MCLVKKIVILLHLVRFAVGDTKIWQYDYDITNPKNWVEKRTGKNCDGVVFPMIQETVFIDSLSVKSMVLPVMGSIEFTANGFIKFDENSKEEINCATIKQFQLHNWIHADAWLTEGDFNNSAIPHAERPPCDHDDVVFPNGVKTSVVAIDSNGKTRKIRSLKFGNDTFDTNWRLRRFLSKSYVAELIFGDTIADTDTLIIDRDTCPDPTGCPCGNHDEGFCENIPEQTDFQCVNPINPVGFCNAICGASIHFRHRQGFNLNSMKSRLRQFDSDTHASKVFNQNDEDYATIIQVIFSEKEFTGNSLDEASDFMNIVKNEYARVGTDVTIMASGYALKKGTKSTVVLMIFGTLFGAILMFAILFFIYSPQLYHRIGLGNRPLSTYLLARYDNIEDRGYFFERDHLVVEPLEKSFENPMFGTPTPSCSPSNSGELTDTETVKSGTSSSHENPLYDIINQQEKEVKREAKNEEMIMKDNVENNDQISNEKINDDEDGFVTEEL